MLLAVRMWLAPPALELLASFAPACSPCVMVTSSILTHGRVSVRKSENQTKSIRSTTAPAPPPLTPPPRVHAAPTHFTDVKERLQNV